MDTRVIVLRPTDRAGRRVRFVRWVALSLAMACAHHPTPFVAPAPDVGALDDVVLAPDAAKHQVEVTVRDHGSLTYPMEERRHYVGAQAVTAFVVDTTGRIEPGSLTFLGEVPAPAFRRALCDWSRSVRFGTPRVDGKTTRVLLLRPWDFSVGASPSRPLPSIDGFLSMLQHMTSADAASWLGQMPRCQS
jgi:hypothetical protein